ncbi:hypothetical protein ACUOA9_40820, partial [Escherichia sp. HC-TM1]
PFAVNNATGEVTINTPLNSPKGIKGNSDTATKLQTAIKISGVSFDGSTDITLTAAHVAAFARTKEPGKFLSSQQTVEL